MHRIPSQFVQATAHPGSIFQLIEGLTPVNRDALIEYELEMVEEGIPAIVRAVKNRQQLAADARQRIMDFR